MKKTIISSIMISVFFFGFVGHVSAAGNATLTFSPSSGSYKVGQNFNVGITVAANGESYDTVRTRLSYPADMLEVVNFSLAPAFAFSSGSNSFNNSAGIFSWGAGIPGGASNAQTFGVLTFKVKKEGQALVKSSLDSLIISAGENKFDGKTASATFTLSPVAIAPAPTAPAAKPAPKTTTVKTEPEAAASVPVDENVDLEPVVSAPLMRPLDDLAATPRIEVGNRLSATDIAVIVALAILTAVFIGGVVHKIRSRRKNIVDLMGQVK